jgi:hypothetical protein
MSMNATNLHILAKQQIEQEADQPRRSNKRLISKNCRQILLNPKSTQKERLKAAQILERVERLKELASTRKAKSSKQSKKVKNSPINDILERASNS